MCERCGSDRWLALPYGSSPSHYDLHPPPSPTIKPLACQLLTLAALCPFSQSHPATPGPASPAPSRLRAVPSTTRSSAPSFRIHLALSHSFESPGRPQLSYYLYAMVQRRRSTLSFRPKSAHPAADPEPDNQIPRPPKRTQSQVFGPHDVEAEASAWRHAHHAGPEKEAKLSHDTHRQESHRRQSTLHNIELALSTVRDLIHRRGQSQSQSAPAPSAGPSRSQEATVDMRPQRSPSFANPPSDADVESLASSSPLQPSQTVPSSKHQGPKRWASARRSLKKFRRPAVSGPANDRWNPLPPPSLGPPYIDHNTGQAARDSANQLNAMNLSLHSRSRSKVSPCGQMSETDSVIGDDQGQLVAQPPRMGTSPPAILLRLLSPMLTQSARLRPTIPPRTVRARLHVPRCLVPRHLRACVAWLEGTRPVPPCVACCLQPPV